MSLINYAVCEPGGKVLRWGMAPSEEVAQAQSGPGEVVIFPPLIPVLQPGEVMLADVETGVLRVSNLAPSPHHIYDDQAGDWVDPRTLADLQQQAWERIKAARDAAEYGGFDWQGHVFDSDQIGQARITGAVQLAVMDADFSIDWTLADNSALKLSAAQMCAVGVALGMHVNAQHARARVLREAINAPGITSEQLAAITFSTEE